MACCIVDPLIIKVLTFSPLAFLFDLFGEFQGMIQKYFLPVMQAGRLHK